MTRQSIPMPANQIRAVPNLYRSTSWRVNSRLGKILSEPMVIAPLYVSLRILAKTKDTFSDRRVFHVDGFPSTSCERAGEDHILRLHVQHRQRVLDIGYLYFSQLISLIQIANPLHRVHERCLHRSARLRSKQSCFHACHQNDRHTCEGHTDPRQLHRTWHLPQ